MTNLKLKKDGDFEYENRPEGDTIRVTVKYWKEARYRGVYVRISPLLLGPDGCVNCILGRDFHILLMATPRKNDKLTAAIAAKLDALVPEAARLFEGKGPEPCVDNSSDILFAQDRRVKQHGNPAAAIELLRAAIVDDVAAVSRVAKGL